MKLGAKARLRLTALSSDKFLKLSPKAVVQLAQAYVTESNRLLKILQYLCYEMDVGEPEQSLMDGKAVRALATTMLTHGVSRWWMTLHAPLINTIGLCPEQVEFVNKKMEPAMRAGQRRLHELFDKATRQVHADLWDSSDDIGSTIGCEPTDENQDLIHKMDESIVESSDATDLFQFNQMGGLTSAKTRLRSTQ